MYWNIKLFAPSQIDNTTRLVKFYTTPFSTTGDISGYRHRNAIIWRWCFTL